MSSAPTRITVKSEMTPANIMDMKWEWTMNESMLCGLIKDWYREHKSYIKYNILPLNAVTDMIYRNYYPGWEFKSKPLVLTGRFRTSIRKDIFKAISFASEYDPKVLVIHLLCESSEIRKHCERFVKQYYELVRYTSVCEKYSPKNICDIVEFFGLYDLPYICRGFCKWMHRTVITIVDVDIPSLQAL